MRDSDEVREQVDQALERVYSSDGSKFPGMTYEEGVAAALLWALGETDEVPMAD
jgi:hypothetical protein